MNFIQSFTLVLLVKGRHEFTRRWLTYMKNINFHFPIIIADGQDDEETDKIIKEINNKNQLSIKYLRYNTHSSYEEYYKMKLDALNKVDTDLVMLCDNDDFILPSGLKDQIIFLSQNQEYISCSGRVLNFEINDFNYTAHGKEISFLSSCNYYRYDEPLQDWKSQIDSVFTQFQPNFFNIFRTRFLKIIAEDEVRLNFSDLVINEFYIQLRAATLGKSKILASNFHYIRQRGTSSISRNYEFSKDLLTKDMPTDMRKLANNISEKICELSTYTKQNLYNIILESFSKYLNYYLSCTTLKFRFSRFYSIKIYLLNLFKNKMVFFLKIKNRISSYINLKKIFLLSDKDKVIFLKKELLYIKSFLVKQN